MSYIYCIYTDKEILEDQTNLEHIIPLSLGGSNDFVIRVDKQVNSTLGAEIDGKLANDFPIQMLRMHKQAKGHSRKKVTAKFKKSKIISSKKPVQVDFTDKGLKIFDPIEKRHIEKTEYDKIELQSIYTPDGYARIRFTAKTLLAAGYFVYGGVFRQQADHAGLREYMNSAGSKTERGSRTSAIETL
jgi:predicted ribonuclease YlaK